MQLDGPNKREWVNAIEVEAWKPCLGYVILAHVMNVTFVLPININA